jgi:hypothetical protein
MFLACMTKLAWFADVFIASGLLQFSTIERNLSLIKFREILVESCIDGMSKNEAVRGGREESRCDGRWEP